MYEELVKALRNCGYPNSYRYCPNCVFVGKYGGSCELKKLLPAAAAAIEELQKANCELLFRVGQAEALIDYYQTGKMPMPEPPKEET